MSQRAGPFFMPDGRAAPLIISLPLQRTAPVLSDIAGDKLCIPCCLCGAYSPTRVLCSQHLSSVVQINLPLCSGAKVCAVNEPFNKQGVCNGFEKRLFVRASVHICARVFGDLQGVTGVLCLGAVPSAERLLPASQSNDRSGVVVDPGEPVSRATCSAAQTQENPCPGGCR